MSAIRAYKDQDLDAVLNCFRRSVHGIGGRFYSPEQTAAWAPESLDRDAWAARLRDGGVFVADVDGNVAGFVRVESIGYVDLLYVHPAYERRGIGRQLLESACAWAMSRGAQKLTAEVSLAARPLFAAMGFSVDCEQVVERRGVQLSNFRMAKNR